MVTIQNGSLIDGNFKLGTTWPHEYEVNIPSYYESIGLPWNIQASKLKDELEFIFEGVEQVFGKLAITRLPYLPSTHNRWSGGYTWTITFLSRGGNIPMMEVNMYELEGTNAKLSILDEASGSFDLYQGSLNFNYFSFDNPGTSRD